MKAILYPFMLLAACGFVISVAAHGLALAGEPIPPFIPGLNLFWVLHLGIFVVWIPAVLVSNRGTRFADRKDFWKITLAGCPAWMRHVITGLFCYALLNFVIFFMTNTPRHPKTNAPPTPSVIRGFSGHWMLFYGVAFAVLYSSIHAPSLGRERKCPQGHWVSPLDRFCPKCGNPLPEESGKANGEA